MSNTVVLTTYNPEKFKLNGGEIFASVSGEFYILACISHKDEFCFINLKSGNRYLEPVYLSEIKNQILAYGLRYIGNAKITIEPI